MGVYLAVSLARMADFSSSFSLPRSGDAGAVVEEVELHLKLGNVTR